MIPKQKAQQKIDLIKEYLEPTGLTIKELMDRNAYVPLLQLLDAYHYEMNKTQNSIQRQHKEKGNQLDQVYGAIKEPSNNDQMKQTYKIEKNVNGWQRVIINFTVKEKPRWRQFWKPRINSRDFEYSIWVKSNDELYLSKPHIEEK